MKKALSFLLSTVLILSSFCLTVYADSTKNTNGVIYSGNGKQLLECTDKYNSGKTFTVPEGTEEICDGAFLGNTEIETVILPSTLKVIGNDAFSKSAVASVDMSKCVNLKTILNAAFLGCKNLVSAEIPNSVVSVGENAFKGCAKLQTLSVPEIIIPDSCLTECSSLKSVTVKMSDTDKKVYYTGSSKINSDKITASDARTVLRLAAQLDMVLAYSFCYADVNRDGKITAADARKILRAAARLESII